MLPGLPDFTYMALAVILPGEDALAELDDQDQEIGITLRVPRKLFVMVAPPPATITQRNVMQHFGIPPRAYLDLVREGRIAVKRLGQLRVATYEEVRRVLTEGAEARARIRRAMKPATDQPPNPDHVLQEAARYLDSAATPRELRQRRKEIGQKGQEMYQQYQDTLDNGSPNPAANHELCDLALTLELLAAGVRLRGLPSSATASTAQASKPLRKRP